MGTPKNTTKHLFRAWILRMIINADVFAINKWNDHQNVIHLTAIRFPVNILIKQAESKETEPSTNNQLGSRIHYAEKHINIILPNKSNFPEGFPATTMSGQLPFYYMTDNAGGRGWRKRKKGSYSHQKDKRGWLFTREKGNYVERKWWDEKM